jgi:hypothetical protein
MLLSLLTSVLLLGYKLRDTTRLGAVWNKRQDMEKQRAKLARQEAVFAAEMADALLKPPVPDVVHTAHAPIGSSRKHADLGLPKPTDADHHQQFSTCRPCRIICPLQHVGRIWTKC